MQWYIVGILAAIMTSFSFVPQVIKMYRNKSVRDVSPMTFIQFSIGAALWMSYGFHLRDSIIIGANVVVLITLISAISLYLKYSSNKMIASS